MKPDIAMYRKYIKDHREQILNWLIKLISFPTENKPPYGKEGIAIEFLIEELQKLNLELHVFSPDEVDGIEKNPYWLSGRDYSNNRKNVVGIWNGKGNGHSLLLSGHLDVAPKEPDRWSVCKPFQPKIQEGRLYGRGSADMKGGLSSMFWAIKMLKEMGFEPQGNVIFESVVDEEYAGGNGTLASRLKGFNADFAILGEPTRMEICPATMGALLGKIEIEGKAGMPYMGKGIASPIFAAERVIKYIEDFQAIWRKINRHPLFNEPGKELNIIIWDLVSGKRDEFVQMGTPVGVVLSWIIFCYPGTDEEKIYIQFRDFIQNKMDRDRLFDNFKVDIVKDFHFIRPGEIDVNNEALLQFSSSFKRYTEQSVKIGGAPFSCDFALYLNPGNMPTIVFGPRGGNLHAPDEWVQIDDIFDLIGIYADFIVNWCDKR